MALRAGGYNEAAGIMGSTPATLRNWTCTGRFPELEKATIRVGRLVRFDLDALEDLVKSNAFDCAPPKTNGDARTDVPKTESTPGKAKSRKSSKKSKQK